MRTMTEKVTRRMLLTSGALAAATIAVPAVAANPIGVPIDAIDPIFVLIAEHKRLWDEYVLAVHTADDDDELDGVSGADADAVAEEIVVTPPTTAAGAAALLAYVAAGLYEVDDGEATTKFPDADFEDPKGRFPGGRSFLWWVIHYCAETIRAA